MSEVPQRLRDALATERPRCYLAGPAGFTEAGRHWHAAVVLPALSALVDVYDPWAAYDREAHARAAEAGLGSEREYWLGLGHANAEAIRGCDLLAADLDGQEIDSGTASEIGYAAAVGVPVVGVRSDLRGHGERGVRVNLQIEALIEVSGGVLVSGLDELLGLLSR